MKQGVHRVDPPDFLTVLVGVCEDRRGVQHLNIAQVAHEGEVLHVDAVVPQPHPQPDLESILEPIRGMALSGQHPSYRNLGIGVTSSKL